MDKHIYVKVAVLDIGSNSVRLMTTNSCGGLNSKKLITTSLGEGLNLCGFLSEDAMLRTIQAVKNLYDEAKNSLCKKIYVFATEAVRAASNGSEFCNRLKALGIDVDVLSGENEAKIGFLGAKSSFDAPLTVFDIGGASVELVSGDSDSIYYKKSLPLGMLRLYDMFGDDMSKLTNYIYSKITEFGTVPKGNALIGISGTATSLCGIKLGLDVYCPERVHKTKITLSELENIKNQLFKLATPENIMQAYPFLPYKRAKIIKHGVIMTIAILNYCGFDSFIASETDNTEGYLILKSQFTKDSQ